MSESLKVSCTFPVKPQELYEAWLDSKAHSAFTGGKAEIEPEVEGSFTAWDGYIEGETLELDPLHRILQSWRTSEFPEDAEDSSLEVLFKETDGGTTLTFVHTNIPDGQGEQYKTGWEEHYFTPMREYFKSKK